MPWEKVTHVPEHLLPLTPVYTKGEGRGGGERLGVLKC